MDVHKTRFWNAGSTPAVRRHRILNQAPQSPLSIDFANTNIHLSGVCFRIQTKGEKMTIEELEQVLSSVKALIKAKKDYEKLSDKYSKIDFREVSGSQRARSNERLGDAAFDVKVKTDNLHADLVDAGLCEMKERYEQRELRQSAGLGHIYHAAYLPKVPKRYKELQK